MTSSEVSGQVDRLLANVVRDPERPEVIRRLATVLPEQRWRIVAEGCVRGIAAVPEDVQHQQAAVALVTNALAHEGWSDPGQRAADASIRAALIAVDAIEEHYAQRYDDGGGPSHPVRTAPPSREAPVMPLPTATTSESFGAAMSGLTAPSQESLSAAREEPVKATDSPAGAKAQRPDPQIHNR
ncbi:hypothetical protein [Kribbella sp. NPDC055071]